MNGKLRLMPLGYLIVTAMMLHAGSAHAQNTSLEAVRNAAEALDSKGVRVDLTFVDDFIANPGSGENQSQVGNLGLWGFNADFDLGKLIGLQGGTVHEAMTIYGLRVNSHMLQDVDGNLGTLSYLKYHDAVVLNLLTYEQKIGKLDLEGGRTNPLRYFWQMNCDNRYACEPGIMNADMPLMPLRYATWGGVATYNINNALYFRGGGFEDDRYNLNTNGLNFNTIHATGALGVGEIGYTTSFATSAYPSHYEFGAFGDTTTHTNPYMTALGNLVVTHPGDPKKTDAGPVGIFAEGRQVVWKKNAAKLPPNFAITWGVFAPLNGHQDFDFESWAGGIWTGIIPGRPLDDLGFRVHYIQLSQDLANSETAARIHAGGNSIEQPRNEFSLEASYNFQIAPGILFSPDIQYLINQDTYYNANVRKAPGNGLVVSGFLTVSLARILGLPTPR